MNLSAGQSISGFRKTEAKVLTHRPGCYNIDYNNKGGVCMKAKVSQIGNSIGVILPKEAVMRLKIKKGDSVFLTETSDGYVVTPYDPEFENQMAVAREGMAEFRNALRELAK